MSDLKQQISGDMKAAMKGGDKPRLAVIRLISAAIKQREVDERIELDNDQIIAVLDKMAKQRRESIEQYRSAGRDDLLAQEEYELGVLQDYLPAQLTAEELSALIDDAINTSGASSIREMGKVMGILKPALQGRADMSQVSADIKAKLSS